MTDPEVCRKVMNAFEKCSITRKIFLQVRIWICKVTCVIENSLPKTCIYEYEPFNVSATVPLEARSLGKNFFLLEHRILGLT
ncbi:hypothetical protein TNCV_1185161 [Trichonephila clavipes]|nr:hypothetical protein TNCV_1185161 [Trichonephila clavipes]